MQEQNDKDVNQTSSMFSYNEIDRTIQQCSLKYELSEYTTLQRIVSPTMSGMSSDGDEDMMIRRRLPTHTHNTLTSQRYKNIGLSLLTH